MLGISMPCTESNKTKAVTRIMNIGKTGNMYDIYWWFFISATTNFKCEYYGKGKTNDWIVIRQLVSIITGPLVLSVNKSRL